MPKPRFMFYHDGRHPLIYMYEPPLEKEEYESGVDELLGTPIEALMFCLGDGRTVLHDTKVGELWGHNVKKWPSLVFNRAHRNVKHLIREGHDPLRIICERARAFGMLIYPTLLVQQGRGEPGKDVRCSDFRFNNSHLEIGARGDLDPDFPGSTCLDFKYDEVRDNLFSLISEVLTSYPVDGFELQLNYGLHYFHPNEVASGRGIMTAWIERIYKAVKQSGPERELAVRIPASIDGCLRIGLDVRQWLKQGIVDVIIGQSFSNSELIDPMTDFRPLVEASRNSECRVHAALQSHLDSDRLSEAPIEMIRAAACNYWAQGVDGLYLAHWFGNWPYGAEFYEKLRELPYPAVMASKDKFYFLPTMTGRYPKPLLEPGLSMQLPAALEEQKPVDLNFQVSDNLSELQKTGRVHEVILRIRVMNATERDNLSFSLNEQELPESILRKINEMYRMHAPRYRTGSGYWFVYRLDPARWPQKGGNRLKAVLLNRDPDVTPQAVIRDVEIEIKYLMGKNFRRGEDADLGPFENSGI